MAGDEEPAGGGLHAAELYCDSCGRRTVHRVLHLVGGGLPDAGGTIQGTARCRECRLVHPFVTEPPRSVEVGEVRSEGGRSEAVRRVLPAGTVLRRGALLPDSSTPTRVLRIDDQDGTSVAAAKVEEVRTIWTTETTTVRVPVSIVEGRTTRASRVELDPEERVVVGSEFDLDRRTLLVAAVRAQGATWHDPGEEFPAAEVDRIYARRAAIPPAGRSDWSTGRGIPSSRASSTSRSDRSRSSPGTRTVRRRPRERSADGGAAHHRSAPSTLTVPSPISIVSSRR